MSKQNENDSKAIVKKLSIFFVLFYLIYYILSIILVGGFKVDWSELGKFPFRIDKNEFNPALGGGALGSWLAMVITFTCSIGLTYFVVKQTRKSWDYVVTTSLLHFIICCIVNQAFPTNWIWWVTLIIANALLSLVSEFAIYFMVDMQDIDLGR